MSVSRRAALHIESANGQVEFAIAPSLTDSYTGTMMSQRKELLCMSFEGVASKGTEEERVRMWQDQIKKDFGISVNFEGENDKHPWAKSFDIAASKVRP